MPTDPVLPPSARSGAWRLLGWALRGLVGGFGLAVLLNAGYILVGTNFRVVLPGLAYRCAQPTAEELERAAHRWGVRTVINLRGSCDPAPWYLEQCHTSNRLGISQEDLGFSAGRLPSVHTARQLLEVLDHSEYPILIHCHRGADRTGMVAALVLLLRTNATLEEATGQLGPRYGHLPLGRTRHIDRFFDLYEEWLTEQGLEHRPEVLRQWLRHHYCPGEGRCTLELIDPPALPGKTARVPRGTPFGVVVRCTNTSLKPWRFQPGTNAGIHAQYVLADARQTRGQGRAGLFHATVPPGRHIDLTLALPVLAERGKYTLRVDMVDEQHGAFLQLGAEPLFVELEVP
jgi:hypothetical protein